jgi:hypothetical protein
VLGNITSNLNICNKIDMTSDSNMYNNLFSNSTLKSITLGSLAGFTSNNTGDDEDKDWYIFREISPLSDSSTRYLGRSILNYTFSDCKNLESVDIPCLFNYSNAFNSSATGNSHYVLTRFSSTTFSNCEKLGDINLNCGFTLGANNIKKVINGQYYIMGSVLKSIFSDATDGSLDVLKTENIGIDSQYRNINFYNVTLGSNDLAECKDVLSPVVETFAKTNWRLKINGNDLLNNSLYNSDSSYYDDVCAYIIHNESTSGNGHYHHSLKWPTTWLNFIYVTFDSTNVGNAIVHDSYADFPYGIDNSNNKKYYIDYTIGRDVFGPETHEIWKDYIYSRYEGLLPDPEGNAVLLPTYDPYLETVDGTQVYSGTATYVRIRKIYNMPENGVPLINKTNNIPELIQFTDVPIGMNWIDYIKKYKPSIQVEYYAFLMDDYITKTRLDNWDEDRFLGEDTTYIKGKFKTEEIYLEYIPYDVLKQYGKGLDTNLKQGIIGFKVPIYSPPTGGLRYDTAVEHMPDSVLDTYWKKRTPYDYAIYVVTCTGHKDGLDNSIKSPYVHPYSVIINYDTNPIVDTGTKLKYDIHRLSYFRTPYLKGFTNTELQILNNSGYGYNTDTTLTYITNISNTDVKNIFSTEARYYIPHNSYK